MARKAILLTRQDIAANIDIVAAVPAIEEAMGAFEKGEDYLPPKTILEIPVGDPGTAYAACITGYTKTTGLMTMKVGHERTHNGERGLPTTEAWVMVFEPETGELLMMCDGTLPTMLRTACAAAVGTKQLAREDAKVLSVIGAGQLGRQCLRAVSTVRDFEKIYLHDVVAEFAADVARELSAELAIPIEAAAAQTSCELADVIVTATNSRAPIIKTSWVRTGTHLSCMGTDMAEKIECEMSLLPSCRIFADKADHAILRGEVSQAVAAGILGEDCYLGSLGQVINGDVPGRLSANDITMFDGVGIGIQDTTIARTIYDQAMAQGLGTRLAFS
jgi:alanine dehydrogenase